MFSTVSKAPSPSMQDIGTSTRRGSKRSISRSGRASVEVGGEGEAFSSSVLVPSSSTMYFSQPDDLRNNSSGAAKLSSRRRTSSRHQEEQQEHQVSEDGAAPLPATSSMSSTYRMRSSWRERSSLVTLSLVVLALSGMAVQGVEAAQACKVDSDCGSIRGRADCVANSHGKSFCVYSSCSAGFYGGGNTYTECFECPNEMTSLAGKAFMKTDCFLPCGDGRCYKPEDGYAECIVEAATVSHVCLQTCNQENYIVSNPGRSYATCIADPNNKVIDQSQSNTGVKMRLAQRSAVSPIARSDEGELPTAKKFMKKRTSGRRLRGGADLHAQGPAAAMLVEKDPLALLSK